MRFLVRNVKLDSRGNEREAIGSSGAFFFEYASVQNLIKFGLSKPGVPPGQYNIYHAPLGDYSPETKEPIATAYKRITPKEAIAMREAGLGPMPPTNQTKS